MALLLFALLALYFTYPKKDNQLFGRIPIAINLGWIFFATIANISYVLTLHEWSGWGLSDPLWTVIYLTFATAIALHFLYHHADIALSSVFMWAFIGIAVKNGVDELFVSAAALFLTAVIGAIIFSQENNLQLQNKKIAVPPLRRTAIFHVRCSKRGAVVNNNEATSADKMMEGIIKLALYTSE